MSWLETESETLRDRGDRNRSLTQGNHIAFDAIAQGGDEDRARGKGTKAGYPGACEGDPAGPCSPVRILNPRRCCAVRGQPAQRVPFQTSEAAAAMGAEQTATTLDPFLLQWQWGSSLG